MAFALRESFSEPARPSLSGRLGAGNDGCLKDNLALSLVAQEERRSSITLISVP
jgi:hypothetical protein